MDLLTTTLFPRAIGDGASATQTSAVYDRLRDDILCGRLRPALKLQMRFLMERYGMGQTPLREALNRLSAEGLVQCRDQRGFTVTGISETELEELTRTRCWVECLALRESMRAASPDWEEQIVLAHHRLSRTPRSRDPELFADNAEWERHHERFHQLLVAGCGSRPLIAFCRQIADQLLRYRRLSARKAFAQRRPIADEHKAICEAVLDHDVTRATELLASHYQATANVILGDASIFATNAPD